MLVDSRGEPRVRCACGNPLRAPVAAASAPQYVGTPWPGLAPARTAVLAPAPQPVAVFVLQDHGTGQTFARPSGTDGTADGAAPSPTTTTTAPVTTTTPPTRATTSTSRATTSTSTTASTTATSSTSTTVPPTDDADTIAGYWTGSWGELVLRVEGTSVRGVYQHDAGTVTGTYDPATRTFTGWWCEAYSRAPSGDAGENTAVPPLGAENAVPLADVATRTS